MSNINDMRVVLFDETAKTFIDEAFKEWKWELPITLEDLIRKIINDSVKTDYIYFAGVSDFDYDENFNISFNLITNGNKKFSVVLEEGKKYLCPIRNTMIISRDPKAIITYDNGIEKRTDEFEILDSELHHGYIEINNAQNGNTLKSMMSSSGDEFGCIFKNNSAKLTLTISSKENEFVNYDNLEEYLKDLILKSPTTPITQIYSLIQKYFGNQENYSEVLMYLVKNCSMEGNAYEDSCIRFHNGKLKNFLMTNDNGSYICDENNIWRKIKDREWPVEKEITSEECVPLEIKNQKMLIK